VDARRTPTARRAAVRRLGALAMLGTVAALAVLPFATSAGAQSPTTSTTTTTFVSEPTTTLLPAGTTGSTGSTAACNPAQGLAWRGIPVQSNPYATRNAGTPNSTLTVFNKHGQLIAYGNRSVSYVAPQLLSNLSFASLFCLGEQLYAVNCSACHGVTANGVPLPGTPVEGSPPPGDGPTAFPILQHVGPATIDFWIESGRMPATSTRLTQPTRRVPRLDHLQALAIATWLNARWPGTPYIPVDIATKGASLSEGATLFSINCAACHTITGDGDALANDTFAPSLRDITATQVAEALRTGPANMPVFSGNLTDAQLAAVVAYVTQKIQHPENPGGLGLGGLGPVGEGFVGLALGVGLLALLGFWIGDRA
jgi:ubiquinol-cytochrome c reductase cytochrome c subunit